MKSVMNHNFSQIPTPEIQRSVFNRSHGHKTTFNSGDLIPFYVDEILPGDTMSFSANLFARLSTLIFPIMDNIFLETFYFFVPARLLWSKWEKFNGAQDNPGDTIDYTIPIIDTTGLTDGEYPEGGIADYFGLPIKQDIQYGAQANALPFRAYNLIWNEWFRDENLQNKLTVPLTDGPDLYSLYSIKKRGKRHDYFTSALPWPQKGTAVALPIGTSAPVIGNGTTIGLGDGLQEFGLYGITGAAQTIGITVNSVQDPTGSLVTPANPNNTRSLGLLGDPDKSGMIADLSSAVAATINQLREAFQIQKVMERDARGGTRYVEMLKAHFGVTVPDFRLQRPEYLGGSSQRINISQVAQTSESATTPQGNLSAFGTVASSARFNKSFVEHGYVLGLVNVRADITYQQGVNKLWSRSTRYDFYLPALAHLGEQAVLNKEIYYSDTTNNDAVFGYQERWAEYRYKPSIVTGKFRHNATGTLDSWHLATWFSSLPALNSTFIQDAPPIDRVVAVTEEPQILFDSYMEIKHARPMPVYSVPGQIDRF